MGNLKPWNLKPENLKPEELKTCGTRNDPGVDTCDDE